MIGSILSVLFVIVVIIFTLAILVIPHELGHLLTAKKFKIKVLEFGFGFPPQAFKKKIGETLVTINWLPLGGFVRLYGEDSIDKKDPDYNRSFMAQKVWIRTSVILAGVIVNLVLACLLFYVYLMANNFSSRLPLYNPDMKFNLVDQQNETLVMVSLINPGSPAEAAGLKVGDRILAFNDSFITSDRQLISEINQNIGKQVKLTLSDFDKTNFRVVNLTPRVSPPKGQGAMGVALDPIMIANLNYNSPLQKIFAGPIEGLNLAVYQYQVIGKLLSNAFQTKNFTQVSENVAGPIGIFSQIQQIISNKQAIPNYIFTLAVMSLNLGLINVLPIPPLDGGRLPFLLFEGITRKKAHVNIEKYAQIVGFVLIMALFLLVTISDIRKIIPI